MSSNREGTSTFDWWVKYEDNDEGKTLSKEDLGDYTSDYVRYWNFITDRGWSKIEKMWTSPDGKYKYNNVYDAYRCQTFVEMLKS